MQINDRIHGFVWTSMQANNCNTYLIDGPLRVLIDPGHLQFFDHVRQGLEDLGLTPQDIDLVICTHAHPDHIEALEVFKSLPAKSAMHESEWSAALDMVRYFGPNMAQRLKSLEPDIFLVQGDLTLKGDDFQIFHVPGHSPGSIALYWPARKALFTGDLIFREGVGRTDLPGGNGEALKASIERLTDLDIEVLLPGHGDPVMGAREVQDNFEQIQNFYFRYI